MRWLPLQVAVVLAAVVGFSSSAFARGSCPNGTPPGTTAFRSVQGTSVLVLIRPSGSFTPDPVPGNSDERTQFIEFTINPSKVLRAVPEATGVQSITWRLEIEDPEFDGEWIPLAEDVIDLNQAFDATSGTIAVTATPTVQVPVGVKVRLQALVVYLTTDDVSPNPITVYLSTNQRNGRRYHYGYGGHGRGGDRCDGDRRGDYGRGDYGRGDYGRGDYGRGDYGRGDSSDCSRGRDKSRRTSWR